MTFITKVGVSYVNYMNDDALKVDSFSHEFLSSPEERDWEQDYFLIAFNHTLKLSHQDVVKGSLGQNLGL